MSTSKLRIAVCFITKNEDELLKRALASAVEADEIHVGDTASSEATKQVCDEYFAYHHNITVAPFRFDDARNATLAVVPNDIDVCVWLDSDEVLAEGWREEIEAKWTKDTTVMRYMYDWSKGVRFHQSKIHARKGYRWVSPCHETLTYYDSGKEVWAATDKFLMYHHPDDSKSRRNYLSLLHMGYKEAPHIPRNVLYFGRELFFSTLWYPDEPKFKEQATKVLYEFLGMENGYLAERVYAYRLLGRLNQDTEAFSLALDENSKLPQPHRCPYIWYAHYLYSAKLYELAQRALRDALKIKDRTTDYMVDPNSWSGYPHHLLSWCMWHLGDKMSAVNWAEMALREEPDNEHYTKCLRKFKDEEAPKV